ALNADQVTISVSDGSVSHNRFRLQRALLRLGADGDDGDIQIYPSTNGDLSSPTVAAAIHLNGSNSTMTMRNATGVTASLSGGSGDLRIGGSGVDGDIFLFDSDGGQSFRVDGNGGNLFLGGDGQDGDLAIYRSEETNNGNFNEAVFHFDGDSATLRIGGNGENGRVNLNRSEGDTTVRLDGNSGNIILGGGGEDGDLILRSTDGTDAITLDGQGANLWMGGNGRDGDIVLFAASANTHNDTAQATIHLNGDAGDIILRNADCAEEFTVEHETTAEPGTVMVLGEDAVLKPCARAFDKSAVGVVSGAGEYKPGIVLDRQDDMTNRRPIALVGKVYVKVTNANGPIAIGDLLTTSAVEGHAMRADNPLDAFGAVVGKALAPFDEATGMIPMVVALQ
ncbi:MAG: hypothetical protein AAFQ51_07535, partial [Pseudomonadota bacterium]